MSNSPDLRQQVAFPEVTDPAERAALARDTNLDSATQEAFARETEMLVWTNLAENPSITPRAQEILIEETGDYYSRKKIPVVLHLLARNPSVTPDIQDQILLRGGDEALQALAANSSVTPRAVAVLENNPNENIRKAFAQNFSAPPRILDDLWTMSVARSDQLLLADLAENPSLPPERLGQACDLRKVVAVRMGAARNSNLPAELHGGLARDPDEDVRYWMAWRSDLSEDLIMNLIADSSSLVRGTLARRENLPAAAQEILSFDSSSDVRLGLYANPSRKITDRFSVAFLSLYDLLDAEEVQEILGAACDPQTVQGLSPNWKKDLASLIEATRLIHR